MKQEKNKQLLWIFLACILVTSFQLCSILTKRTITDDEGISYIAATGHQGVYNDSRPKGKWVEATEWKKLWEPDRKFCFETIGKDIARLDIHPPLYFWILHIWLLIFGTSTIIGPLLNLVFFAFCFYFMVRVGMKIFQSFTLSIASAVVWGISPAVMEYMKEARQYTLLAFCTVVFLSLILTMLKSDGRNNLKLFTAIAIISLAGMLSHYYFSLIIAASFLMVFITGEKSKRWKTFFYLIVTEVLSGIAFILLHPTFFLSFQRQQEQAQSLLISAFWFRMKTTVTTFTSFYFPDILTRPGFVVMILLSVLMLYFLIKKPEWREILSKQFSQTQKSIVIIFLFLTTVTVALYLGFISPQHAMRAKYLSMIHIFIVFTTFIIIAQFNLKYQSLMVWIICIWQFFMGAMLLGKEFKQYSKDEINKAVSTFVADKIILDNDERGVVPTVLWYFPDSTLIFAANQDDLLKEDKTWIDSLDDNSLYISDLGYSNSEEKRNLILKEMSARSFAIIDSTDIRFNNLDRTYKLKNSKY